MDPATKKILPIIIVLAVAIGIFVGLRTHPSSPSPANGPVAASNSVTASDTSRPVFTNTRTNLESSHPAAPSVAPAASPLSQGQKPETPFLIGSVDTPPAMDPPTVLGNMRIAINNYNSRFKENPVGTNPEITAALNGDNPKQVKFINEESGLRINGRGELVDYWGTPFFFHQLSGTEMEIRSAGPDKKMWTADDLVTK